MKTAALLPTPGNPYLVAYWLRHWECVWRDEVDDLFVLVNWQPDAEVRRVIREMVEGRGAHYDERESGTSSHGLALNILIHDCDADAVVLCEDDAFVRQPGAVDRAFHRIEDGSTDVVASPRTSMSTGLHNEAEARWGTRPDLADGANGYGMWPAFVFAHRDTLLSTNRNYDACGWGPGLSVPGLDWTIPLDRGPLGVQVEAADTFGSAALQLRARYRIHDEVQYKGPHRWIDWLECGHDIPWFHIGSLSSSGNLSCEHEVAGGRTDLSHEEKVEWSHRLHWWQRFLDTAGDAFPERQVLYRENLTRLRDAMGVRQDEVDAWRPVIDRLITWNEA